MKTYHLHQKQFLPLSLEEAWQFFSSPKNLVKITPAYMDFKIRRISGNSNEMYQGQMISYKIKLFPFVHLSWLTEITHVNRPYYFVDEQRSGPYALWHHEHHFKEVDGGIEMTDEIFYALPLGILGRFAHWLFVERQLKNIFQYRFDILQKTFGNVKLKITKTA